jgi:sugar/nucleoside kinase (ribokinase family)
VEPCLNRPRPTFDEGGQERMRRPVLFAAGYVNVDLVAEVDCVPDFGERVTARCIYRSPGGMTANLACAAARLGLRTRFFGSVGEDEEGDAALVELRRYGVDTGGITRMVRPTTTSIVLLGPHGDRGIVNEPMVFDYAFLEQALDGFTEEAGCLHIDGYRLPEALWLLRKARNLRLVTSADLDGLNADVLADLVEEIAPALDLVFLNKALASALAGEPKKAATKLLALGTRVVAVTLGAEGALVAQPGQMTRVPAASPGVVRDTTGAGDVFAAAFLALWLGGAEVEQAGRFAVVASGLSVTGVGARGYLPDREEVMEIVRSEKRWGTSVAERSDAR